MLAVVACHKDAEKPSPPPPPKIAPAPAPPADANVAPTAGTYPDLGAALTATVPADTRVIGFGELHVRTDRAQVKSALARFTSDALPAIGDKLSDLIVETWIVDPHCGKPAVEATAKIAITTRRPTETKSEIAQLADAARAKGIQPHAMRIGFDDYAKIAPKDKDVDISAMLTLTTKELTRIATEAVVHRDKEAEHRPWIALYGGALHNDRFPDKGVEEWSYAAKVDAITHDKFVEIDLIVPELVRNEAPWTDLPWFSHYAPALSEHQTLLYRTGPASFVLIFPRSAATQETKTP